MAGNPDYRGQGPRGLIRDEGPKIAGLAALPRIAVSLQHRSHKQVVAPADLTMSHLAYIEENPVIVGQDYLM